MKKLLLLLAFVSIAAFAEPSFNQVETLIGNQQYAAAEQGLEQIIKNHPNSAKAYYAMAQAQAGLGNQEKARYALDKATGLDPSLSFASEENVRSLREAITPQTKKIEVVKEPSHWFRNLMILVVLVLSGYFLWRYIKSNNDDTAPSTNVGQVPPNIPPTAPSSRSYTASQATPSAATYTPPTAGQPTIVNNHYGSSNDGLITGMMMGSILSNNHSHDTIIEREVVREAPSRDSSWDSTPSPAPSRDSSWDSDSSSKSSSWDSDSSSSSSSWDSSSSSSDSSWDSGSSSGGSDW